ncbi:MAG TPA: outer membrane protein assembly factor BamA [Terriglobales bacterium]
MDAKSPQIQPVEENTKPPNGSIAPYEGLKVENVELSGISNPGDLRRTRDLIPIREGDTLRRERVRESIQALHGTGRFADIRVEAEHAGQGGVSLNFLTEANYFVGSITVEGLRGKPTSGQVANASKLQLGEVFTAEKLERGLKNIRQLMEESGFYRYALETEELRHPETQQIDLLLRITPGEQAHVGRISITGNENYSQGQIQDIAHLHPGDFVSSQRLTQALERIRKKYQKGNRWLAEVTITERSYRPEGNAVDYSIQINPGPTVDIETEGFKLSRSVLRRNVPVYQESALDDDLLNEGRRNLLNYLQSRGYFEAKVELQRRQLNGGKELRVVYVIDAGPRHRLVQIQITGNRYFLTEELLSHMEVQPAGRLLSQGRYSDRLLADDISALENLYRANGFRDVSITSNVQDDYQGVENDLAVTVQVEEGPQSRVNTLRITGNQTFSEDELRANISTQEGQPFSEYYIAQDRETILGYYFNNGFPEAAFEASAKPAPADPNLRDVTFTIHEGKRIFVNQVYVSGLHYTRPFVAQRELAVQPGDPLSQIDMLRTQQRLYDLGIFSQVDTAVQNPQGSESQKNVLVNTEEAKRYTFNYGLGLEFQTGQPTGGAQGETGVSPRVSFGVTRLNFRGRNHTVSFKTNVGRLQQRALVSYEAPRWFNTRRLTLTITTFYDNTLDVTTFTSQRLEGSVRIDQVLGDPEALTKADTLRYQLTYRRVRASDISNTITPEQIPLLSQPVRVGMPSLSYIHDRRDNPLDPTRGNYSTLDSGVASGYFGSEADFSRILIQNSTYHAFGKGRRPERKFVFARSTRVGIENPFSNTINVLPGDSIPMGRTVIPLPERFFMGGGNSHRGFGLNQAGPRDPSSGFPLGGSALFLNNLELRTPPVTLPFFQDNISFAVFHDAGNVFIDGNSMLHNLLRWRQKSPDLCRQPESTDPQNTGVRCDYSYISHAVGLGVRYKTPIGPVRFDFGYNLNPPAFPSTRTSPDPNDPTQVISTFVPQQARHFNVSFSIGQTF